MECSVVPGVDQRSAQRYAEHVAGSLHEISDAEGYRPFYLCLLGAARVERRATSLGDNISVSLAGINEVVLRAHGD